MFIIFLLNLSDEIFSDRCGISADVIFDERLFGQTQTKTLSRKKDAITKIYELLREKISRVYKFSICSIAPMLGPGLKVFSGHSFIVIQHSCNKENKNFYKVIQSFYKGWHVREDLRKNTFCYLKPRSINSKNY